MGEMKRFINNGSETVIRDAVLSPQDAISFEQSEGALASHALTTLEDIIKEHEWGAQAWQYYDAGDFVLAEAAVKKVLEINPTDADAQEFLDYLQLVKEGFPIDNGTLKSYRGRARHIILPRCVTQFAQFDFDGVPIGPFTFCPPFETIVLPDTITQIPSGCFYGCESLREILLPRSITCIDELAFAHCVSLETITIPDSVTLIGNGAFRDCTSLRMVVIPESVVKIGFNAFSGCTSLETIRIPESASSIGSYAFDGCESLREVFLPNGIAINATVFRGTPFEYAQRFSYC